MKKWFVVLALVSLGLPSRLQAQFEYFNQTTTQSTMGWPETTTNLLYHNDRYISLSIGVIDGLYYYPFNQYDLQGGFIQQQSYSFDDEFLFVGVTTSFNKIPLEDAFLMSHAKEDTISMKGFLIIIGFIKGRRRKLC